MKQESKIAERPERNGEKVVAGFAALATTAMLLLAPAAHAGGAGPTGPSKAVSFEEIPGSTIKRVILTARAAERLGIETGKVAEEPIVRNQMVGGKVIAPKTGQLEPNAKLTNDQFGAFGKVAASITPQPVVAPPTAPVVDGTWVHVTLSGGEWDRIAQAAPARILTLATRDDLKNKVLALPSKMPPVRDIKRSMLSLYFVVPGKDHGLLLYQRVRVELQLTGSGEKRMVVPYSAVYYDGKGAPWVYVNPEPLVFERQRIEVERIVGDVAILTDGPPTGTKIVTVGAALLYGAEVIYKR